jgi:hypothetical protein
MLTRRDLLSTASLSALALSFPKVSLLEADASIHGGPPVGPSQRTMFNMDYVYVGEYVYTDYIRSAFGGGGVGAGIQPNGFAVARAKTWTQVTFDPVHGWPTRIPCNMTPDFARKICAPPPDPKCQLPSPVKYIW